MPTPRDCAAKALAAGGVPDPKIDLPPPSGTGRVVIILSGISDTASHRPFPERSANLDMTLIDGGQILLEDMQGSDRLAKTVAAAKGCDHCISSGGGGALACAESQPETLATVIAYCPVS